MTTNARDEKWSEWVNHDGKSVPLDDKTKFEYRMRGGTALVAMDKASDYRPGFIHKDSESDIIAYRYKIEEPTEYGWSEWIPVDNGNLDVPLNTPFEVKLKPGKQHLMESYSYSNEDIEFYRYQIKQPEATEEEEEAWKSKERSLCDEIKEGFYSLEKIRTGKQPRYQDAKGEDWIDEFARTATVEEFRGAMRFTIGKYNRRAGKKDELVKEIEKMRDYCCRWLEYERERG